MTTAEHLEGMTDSGKFEILATQVARFLYEDCRAVVHMGVNAQGKTVPSPVDGFVLVPRTKPSRYVMMAFTTSEDLKRKWLYDSTKGSAKTTEDGDLTKASKFASMIRTNDPEGEFCLYLSTNLSPTTDLMKEVYAAASQAHISIEFLERSKLRDFLDTTADGQWLRQAHLGIVAERPSVGLLSHLSVESLAGYRSDALLGSVSRLVRTSACDVTVALLHEPAVNLVLVVGPSGAGKSVLAQAALAEHMNQGGIGIWMPGEIAQQAVTLTDALSATLRSLHGRLDVDIGRSALQLASAERPLWIVIDDINRSTQAARVLEKIISWARPPDGAQKTQNSFRILCPVWELHASAAELRHRSCDWIRLQSVKSFSRKESIACLEKALQESGLTLSPAKLNRYAQCLGDDPILLSIFSDILVRENPQEPEAIADDVIGHYVQGSLQELASRTGDWAGEYRDALDALALQLLVRKNLRPQRRELEAWFPFPSKVTALLKTMTASGRICRSINRGGEEQIEFRHDRILEYFLVQSASQMLVGPGNLPDALADPYFAPQIGVAVASGPISTSRLDWLLANNPLALVVSLASLPTSSSGATEITARVRPWLSSPENRGTAQRNVALYQLAETSSPHVLSVTENIPDGGPHLWEARLRNGDAEAGAHALSVDFYPRVHHRWLESLIADALEKHGPQLVADLRLLLVGAARGPILYGALTLAGYLADPLLADAIIDAFQKASTSDHALTCFLWAGLRCAGEAPERLLSPMMEKLLAVENTSTHSTLSRRQRVEEALAFSGRHGFPDPVLAYLTQLGQGDQYRWIVAGILRNIDHPIAIEFMVRTIAERKAQVQEGSFFPYASMWRDQWRRDTDSRRLSGASLDALSRLWKNPATPDWLQSYAFEVWAEYTDDLETLRGVGIEAPPFADLSLKRRALKGDREVAPALRARIEKNEHRGYWLQFFHHVWRPDFEEMLDNLFTETFVVGQQQPWTDPYYLLAHALRDIPTEPAERLLLRHWPKLAGTPLFLQAALYLSTDKSRKSAAEALANIDNRIEAFKHIGSFFGFKTVGLHDKLRIRHLESLRPYLDEIDPMTIFEVAEWCFRNGFRSWAVTNVKPVCVKRLLDAKHDDDRDFAATMRTRARWFPTDEDLLLRFSAAEATEDTSRLFHFEHLFDEWIDAGEMPARFFGILETWVTSAPSESRRATALAALQIRGGRADLDKLSACFAESGLQTADRHVDRVRYLILRRTLE